jgi:medium-chain acyl-[acyl-carrier-protein] hydrolase
MFCFPYVGGGAHIFNDWRRAIPEHVGLYAIQLPGRGRRFCEAPLDRLQPMVAAIAEALARFDDLPFVFFGHSMGALVAFETARALRRGACQGPAWLFASGFRAPQLADDDAPIHDLPEPAFLAKLQELEGTPAEVLQNEEILRLMLPIVRADFAVVETYRYLPEPPLACPITAFGVLRDKHFGRAHAAAWREQTSSSFEMYMLEGTHFFIHSSRDALLALVARTLSSALSPARAPDPGSGPYFAR